MQSDQLNGIYLHGYQGFVTEEKKAFLNSFGNVYAPKIDYDNQPTILYQLYEEYQSKPLDFVAGTSLGGLLIYHLALLLEVPCLLLNPAVTALDQVKPFIPKEALQQKPNKTVMVLVGAKDEIVNPKSQIDFFHQLDHVGDLIHLEVDADLDHFIPIETFGKSFMKFKTYL